MARHNDVHRNSLTFAQLLARLQAMREAFRTVAALRSALSMRANLLLEILALRHQLGVLARSDRRFRPSDRLLWLCLRRLWLRWREALMLVQPATVARAIVKDSVDAGGARGGGRDDHASNHNFEASLGAWRRRTVSGALRGSTASC